MNFYEKTRNCVYEAGGIGAFITVMVVIITGLATLILYYNF